MAFLKDFGDKLQKAAGGAADKAKDLAEITKKNAEIARLEKNIDSYYTELGKLCYESEKTNASSPLFEQCSKISSALLEVENLRNEIAEIKMQNEVAPAAETTKGNFCPKCGAPCAEGSRFCTKCGSPL